MRNATTGGTMFMEDELKKLDKEEEDDERPKTKEELE